MSEDTPKPSLRARLFPLLRAALRLPGQLARVAAPLWRRALSSAARATVRGLVLVALGAALLTFLSFFVGNALLDGRVAAACRAERLIYEGRGSSPLGEPGIEIWVNHNSTSSPLADALWVDGQYPAFAPELPSGSTRSYRVFVRAGPDSLPREVLHVEARPVRAADGEIRLLLDLALLAEVPEIGKKPVYRRLAWWQTGGLAPSNALARVRPALLGGLRELSFPTGHSSLVTWIKDHWESTTKALAPHYASGGPCHLKAKLLREAVAPELERLLGEELGGLQTSGPLVVVRIFNGLIQMLTFTAFFAALLLVFARYTLFVRAERREATSEQLAALFTELRGESGPWDGEAVLERVLALATDFQERWGVTPSAQQFCIGWLTGRRLQGDGQSLPFAESYGELLRERRESQAYSIRYLVGAIPALGFIGTVLGIGAALMGTGSVLSDQLAKQQSGVSTVALALGLAFDTTFVSLVLSLFVHFTSSWLTAREEEVLHDAKETMFNLLPQTSPEDVAAPPLATPAPPRPAAPRAAPRLVVTDQSGRLKPQGAAPTAPALPDQPAVEVVAPPAAPPTPEPAARPHLYREVRLPVAEEAEEAAAPEPDDSAARAAWHRELNERYAALAGQGAVRAVAALALKSVLLTGLLVGALFLLGT